MAGYGEKKYKGEYSKSPNNFINYESSINLYLSSNMYMTAASNYENNKTKFYMTGSTQCYRYCSCYYVSTRLLLLLLLRI